jgi:hypothetical protein
MYCNSKIMKLTSSTRIILTLINQAIIQTLLIRVIIMMHSLVCLLGEVRQLFGNEVCTVAKRLGDSNGHNTHHSS